MADMTMDSEHIMSSYYRPDLFQHHDHDAVDMADLIMDSEHVVDDMGQLFTEQELKKMELDEKVFMWFQEQAHSHEIFSVGVLVYKFFFYLTSNSTSYRRQKCSPWESMKKWGDALLLHLLAKNRPAQGSGSFPLLYIQS
jgi:hypothetical protein